MLFLGFFLLRLLTSLCSVSASTWCCLSEQNLGLKPQVTWGNHMVVALVPSDCALYGYKHEIEGFGWLVVHLCTLGCR